MKYNSVRFVLTVGFDWNNHQTVRQNINRDSISGYMVNFRIVLCCLYIDVADGLWPIWHVIVRKNTDCKFVTTRVTVLQAIRTSKYRSTRRRWKRWKAEIAPLNSVRRQQHGRVSCSFFANPLGTETSFLLLKRYLMYRYFSLDFYEKSI